MLHRFDPGPVPDPRISGFWGLVEIRLSILGASNGILRILALRRGYISLFLNEEGRLFIPTARHIWDALQTEDPEVCETLSQEESAKAYDLILESAEEAGQEVFKSLQQAHSVSLVREKERGSVAFDSKRKAIERIGLPEVRNYRLARCAAEEAQWRKELEAARQIVPEIRPLLLMYTIGEV